MSDENFIPNPPAFPKTSDGPGEFGSEGMDLRDYFAAKAMQALISNPNSDSKIEEKAKGFGVKPAEFIASFAYGMASAMLSERDKE